PFVPEVIQPQKVSKKSEATHLPFDEDMLARVMKTAAEEGQDWLDLFIVGSQTGMRLKDAALFKWDEIDGDFIEYSPEKTINFGNTARLPISPHLANLLQRRKKQNQNSPYVNPVIAQFYMNGSWPTKKSKKIVEKALGKETTQLSKEGRQRRKNGCIYSFHSFRTTFMTLLAERNVEVRDAMNMLGWESVEMMRLYEKIRAKGREARDQRNKEHINNLVELKFEIPEPKSQPLCPTKEALKRLILLYSNVTIGKIYGISSKAVGNWLVKFRLKRQGRILSPDVKVDEIQRVRRELMVA
ncbi:MAG: tyrosine-type recombinase/integrase, partial [Victivallaceae bacterium]|nr:tyrosine-type recombinase/integrase [Victivallaceae bacterium]